ncbi:hypothetical protein B0T20DRAFT_480404 [Sordaria brevicollis]|uniref:Ecp2 effector protein domain-containing protein n=1 Tax=Sordaria brevicollis TaxID=83679 RepID=A0AAE0PBB7_SORBR|nr:hypothetical protein B0T20DRAFT_480404 [Sordaria brevicollis]
MFNLAPFLIIALFLFLSGKAIAAPTTAAPALHFARNTRFTFSAWIDSITTNPATALPPDQAVNAFLESLKNSDGVPPPTINPNDIFCLTDWTPDISAQAIDAATIIHRFATLGDVPCPAVIKTTHSSGLPSSGSNLTVAVYDVFGTAMLMPQRAGFVSTDPSRLGTCRNIAQTTAVVMDKCTQLNGTVVGLTEYDVTKEKHGVFVAKNPGDFAWP